MASRNWREFLDDDLTEIVVISDQSPLVRELGEVEIVDELRVLIRDKGGTSASYCFSTQLEGGSETRLRVYGPNGSIVVDHSSGSLILEPVPLFLQELPDLFHSAARYCARTLQKRAC